VSLPRVSTTENSSVAPLRVTSTLSITTPSLAVCAAFWGACLRIVVADVFNFTQRRFGAVG
jgi:hypothetical protein